VAVAPSQPPAPLPPTPTAYCVNDAQFMEDLTLPDGTQVLPGAALDKRWLVLNRGECAWGPDYRLVQIGDSRIEGPDARALYPAVAGTQAVWQVQLVAPQEEGEFISRWRAQAPDGTLFGDEVYVLVVVDASPLTPTPIPTAASP
jgi:next-to-BRCA1 protein 1